jgi:acyl-coenzyme A thioesterase PaaI-like protein
MSEFDTDTAVTRLAEGAYAAEVTDRWSIGAVPNGGYTMAIALRGLLEGLGRPDPLTVTAHFLRPAEPGPAELDVEVVKAGRSAVVGSVRLHQGGVERLRLLGSVTDLGATVGGEPHHVEAPPALPPPEQCLRGDGTMPGGGVASVAERFDLRLHPEHVGWARGEPTGRLEVAGWIRPADGRDPDTALLPAVVDAFPPTVFELGAMGWVPTLELTLHVRARPAPGWLRCSVRSRHVSSGLVEEDAEVWDDEDRLVAMSRQISRVPRAR